MLRIAAGLQIQRSGKMLLKNKDLPVGHTGVIIGSPDGQTQYFDFGRFGNNNNIGIVRNFSSPTAQFNNNGIVSNYEDLVRNLYGKGSYFYNKKAYSEPVIGVYTGLHYESMAVFASQHGSKTFGFGEGQSFCTKFVHDVIRSGGGTMPVIADIIMERKDELLDLISNNIFSLQRIIQSTPWLPIPSNFAIEIKKRFPDANK